MIRRLTIAAALCLSVGAAEAATRSLLLGDIVIRYDDALFAVSGGRPSPRPHRIEPPRPTPVLFHCAGGTRCHGDPVLIVSAIPLPDTGGGSGERPSLLTGEGDTRPLWEPGATPGDTPEARDFGGLILTGTVSHSGCRARTPPMYRAAGDHGGFRYVFATGWAYGCGGRDGFPLKDFERFLNGITLTPHSTDP